MSWEKTAATGATPRGPSARRDAGARPPSSLTGQRRSAPPDGAPPTPTARSPRGAGTAHLARRNTGQSAADGTQRGWSESRFCVCSPGLARRGWSVGRVLFPGVLRRTVRRPSISGRRCRRPRAVYPRTRAGSPRACAVRPCSGRGLPSRSGRPDRWWSLAPPFHPYLHHRRSRQARSTTAFRRSVLCGTVPRVAPGGCCPPPCPSEPGPSSTHVVRRAPRPPDQPLRARHRRATGSARARRALRR